MTKCARRLLLTFVVILIFAVGALCFTACKDTKNPPDEDKYTLTLVTGDGGSLAKTQYKLDEGENISNFLKDIRPTPNAGFTFVAWYEGASPLASTRTMPASAVTLTAKYNVTYTVKLYKQAADGSYPSTAQVSTGQAMYGEPFAYQLSEEHFAIDTSRGTYSTDSLTKDAVFEVYAAREAYNVYYLHNIAGATPSVNIDLATVYYGGSVTLADGSEFGLPAYYRFAGWSTSALGEVEYGAGDTLTNVNNDIYLFAQWDRAYLDRFGGSDMIFFPRSDDTVAILVRGGLGEKIGLRDGDSFVFEEVGLRGVVSADGSFAYLKDAQKDTVYLNWDIFNDCLKEDFTLTLDGYMNGSFVYTDEDGAEHEFNGTYRMANSGLYYFSVTQGDYDGYFFYFILTELTESGTPVFITMGQEALYGSVYYARSADLDGNYSLSSSYTAVFDGFGVVSISGLGTFYYRPGEMAGEYVAYLEGMDILRMYIVGFGSGRYGWLMYDEEMAGTYRADDGSTLELDGYGLVATYTLNGQETESMWLVDNYSELQQGYLVVTEAGTFLVNVHTHTFKAVSNPFVELYWLKPDTSNPVVSADRFMVVYDDSAVEIYVNGVLVSRGSYVEGSYGIYNYTQTELLVAGFGLPTSMSFKVCSYFDYYGTMDTYLVYFVVESTDESGQTTKYYHSYFTDSGNEVRAYDVGTADYILSNGDVYEAYSYYQGRYMDPFYYDYLTVTYADNLGRTSTLYFRIEEDESLTALTRLAWSVTQGLPTHGRDDMVILKLDGKDRAYLYPPRDSGRSAMYGSYVVKQIGNEFSSDVVIYTFTSEKDPTYTFDFILTTLDDYEVFIMYDAERVGEYVSASVGTLMLDGFALYAYYHAPNNVLYQGSYYFLGGNAVRFVNEAGATYDFELDVNKRSLIELDGYYGEYRAYDGFEFGYDRVVLHFDGKGGAELGHLDYNDKYVMDAQGSYTVYDDAKGVLIVEINGYDGYNPTRVLLLLVDVGYDEYYAYVRSFADEHTYISDSWEVLMLDGFGYATYIDQQGVAYYDALYTQVSDTEVVFVIGSYAYAVTLNGNSFEITDIYFNPILLAQYGDLSWLYYGDGTLYLSVYQVDEEGTVVVYPTGAISRYGVLTDAQGNEFDIPPVTDYSVLYYGNGGGLITLNFEYNGYYCCIQYTISEFLSSLYYVTSVSYYWTSPTVWTSGSYSVRVYRQVRGSDSSVLAGTVRSFELLIDGNQLPVYSYGKTEGGVDYAAVLDGDYKGYYFVRFTKDGAGVQTGISLVTKLDVMTVTSTDYAEDGTALIATAYYVFSDGELYDIHVRYTQSNFSGYEYDLTTNTVKRLSQDTWYVHCTYNYGGSYYTSDFYYVFTYANGEASIDECMYGYVYSVDGNYAFVALVDYYDLTVYSFDSFYIHGVLADIANVTREGDGSYLISTATAVYNVKIEADSGSIVAKVTVVTDEARKSVTATLDDVTYTVTYSVKLNTDNVLSEVISLAVSDDVLVYYKYANLGEGKFLYVVMDSDYIGYYIITFTLSDSGEVQGVAIEKREIKVIEYTYEYTYGGESSATLFTTYYVLDEQGQLLDVIATTYVIGGGSYVNFFDDYLRLHEITDGTWWMYYLIDTTYYHFALTLGDEPALMLCYYAYTYGSEDSTYTFWLLYDYEGNGHLYGIGALYIGNKLVEITSATRNAEEDSWTVVTADATYKVTFVYDSENEVFSATVVDVTK